MKKLITTLAAVVAMTATAHATNLPGISVEDSSAHSWNGCYVGIAGGMSTATSNIDNDAITLGNDALRGEAAIGCDVQRGNLVFGGRGSFGFGNGEIELFGDSADVGETFWSIIGRFGVTLGEDRGTLAYVGGGYMQSENGRFEDFDLDIKDDKGIVLLGGVETFVTDNVTLGLEVSHFMPEAESYDGTKIERRETSVMLRGNYRFGAN